jgi:hypothetical protein
LRHPPHGGCIEFVSRQSGKKITQTIRARGRFAGDSSKPSKPHLSDGIRPVDLHVDIHSVRRHATDV